MSKFYRAAKISDHRFRRVLDLFVRDETATAAAKVAGLSVNAMNDLYRRLRVFFFDVGLFIDFYGGQDPETVKSDDPVFEQALLGYHLARNRRRRGLKSPATEPPYHFAESCWRFDFQIMMDQRPSDAAYAMMRRHLIELIHLCGPLGATPRNRVEGLRVVMRQADERIDWFRRNAPDYRDPQTRMDLAQARDIVEDR